MELGTIILTAGISLLIIGLHLWAVKDNIRKEISRSFEGWIVDYRGRIKHRLFVKFYEVSGRKCAAGYKEGSGGVIVEDFNEFMSDDKNWRNINGFVFKHRSEALTVAIARMNMHIQHMEKTRDDLVQDLGL